MRLHALLVVFIIQSISNLSFSQTPGSSCDSIATKAIKLYAAKNFKEAIPVLQLATKSCSKDSGMSNKDYYSLVGALSIAYYETGREDSAILTGEPAIGFFEKNKLFNDPLYHTVLGRLGFAYSFYGEYANAVSAFEKCIPFFEQRNGPSHELPIAYSLELARCYAMLNAFEKAYALNQKTRQHILSTKGKNSTSYISVVTNFGNDFLRMGVYDSAYAYHSESLRLRESLVGKNHHEYAKGLSILGQVFDAQNRFADAVIYYEQAKNIYTNAGYNKSVDYATLLNSLAISSKNLGDLDKAFAYLKESLQVKRSFFGNYHPDVATSVNNVGLVLEEMGDYKQALEAYLHSKFLLEKTIGKENQQYAGVLANLGNCYTGMSSFDSALSYLKQSLQLKEKLYGKQHTSIAATLNNIASLYSTTKRYAEAEAAYNQSKNILANTYGKDALQLSTVYQNMALLYRDKGNIDGADSLFNKSYLNSSKFIINNTEGLSEKDKEGFAEDIRLNQYTALSLRQLKPLSNDWIYNSTLFYKGLLLEGAKGFSAALKNLKDTAMQRKAAEYFSLKKTIGVQLLNPEASRSAALPEMISRSSALERELLQASASFRNWKEQFGIDWQQVQKQLQPDEIAIEFLAYYPLHIKTLDSTQYAAMVIKKGMKDPLIIPLFSEGQFNKLATKGGSSEAIVKKLYRSSIKSSAVQSTPSDSLYHLIWKPLLPHVQKIKRIYFSAEGVLNNLNIAAINSPQGKRLIEDYEFVQLSSTRNIMNATAAPQFNNMQLWGGIDYNGNGNSTGNRSSNFAYLPGTLTEIKEISMTAKTLDKKIVNITSADASESAFKKLDGKSPEVLHIATHGFFFADPAKAGMQTDNRFAKATNPLLRSGLALANANNNWLNTMTASGKEDGILTAYEIADLDLSSTKLVVLSACETGLGDIKSGEGVYGLQRAFKMAGVNSIIMSLWQVPDMETKEFMQTFYSHCLAGSSIRKAFRDTQLAMNKKYQPYQWAAFVLVE